MEYFEIFELTPRLQIDLEALEKKFHELSRKYHPDYHTGRTPKERERSLRMTALLNDAYRTLRNPTRRAEYLVESQGLVVDGSQVPKALLAEVFEINEELEALRSARAEGSGTESLVNELRVFQNQIAEWRRDYDDELDRAFTEWDRVVSNPNPSEGRTEQLQKLADVVARSAYLRNLEREIENEVSK